MSDYIYGKCDALCAALNIMMLDASPEFGCTDAQATAFVHTYTRLLEMLELHITMDGANVVSRNKGGSNWFVVLP